jgi:hypothetical protein
VENAVLFLSRFLGRKSGQPSERKRRESDREGPQDPDWKPLEDEPELSPEA